MGKCNMRKIYKPKSALGKDRHDFDNNKIIGDYWKARPWSGRINNNENQVENFRLIIKHLSKDGRTLEGGCGSGIWVKLLKERGYDIIGTDINYKELMKLKRNYRDWNLCVSDVSHLCFKNNSLQPYLSFGVVEHFIEGPEGVLLEAYRVLDNNGLLFVSVPYQNIFRSVWAFFEDRRKKIIDENKYFFEYQFTKKEIVGILEKLGFEITGTRVVGLFTGLQDFRLIKIIFRKLYTSTSNNTKKEGYGGSANSPNFHFHIKRIVVDFIIRKIFYNLAWFCPHMILVIAKVKK